MLAPSPQLNRRYIPVAGSGGSPAASAGAVSVAITFPRVALGALTTYALANGVTDGQIVGIVDNAYTAATVQPTITGSFVGGLASIQLNANGQSLICRWDANSARWELF